MIRARRQLAVSGVVALSLTLAAASAWAGSPGASARLISPAGLGPQYTGLSGAGRGLGDRTAKYGIKAGSFVLQPRLFLETAYDTNFFRVDVRTVGLSGFATPTGVFLLHLRPGLGLYNTGAKSVWVTATADADVRLPLTGGAAASDQTNVGGKAKLSVDFFPRSLFSFNLHDAFSRTLWTRASEFSNANMNRNQLGATLSLKPGGRALEVALGYDWNITRYDALATLSRDAHAFRFLTSWRFYPLTYAFLESTLNLTTYPDRPSVASGYSGNLREGMPLKVYAGVSGNLTERFSVLVRAGYGNSLLETQAGSTDNFSSAVGMLQLSYRFTARTVLHVGGARDYNLVAFGGYQDYVRGFLNFSQRIGDVALLSLDGAFDYRWYGEWDPYPFTLGAQGTTVTPIVSERKRTDMRLRAGALVDFDIHRLFGISVGYRLDWVMSDYNQILSLPSGLTRQFVGYAEHRVFASFNLRY